MTTPPGVAHATAEPRDQATEADRLMREDGSTVCHGDTAGVHSTAHGEVEVWNLPATRCPCRCHLEDDAVGTALTAHTTARSTP